MPSQSIKTEEKNKLQTHHSQNNAYFMITKPCETVALLVHVNIPHQGVFFNTWPVLLRFFSFLFFFRDSTTVSQQLTPSGYNLWAMRLVTKSQLNQSDWSKNLDFQIWFDDEAIGLTVSCTKSSRDQPATKNWKTQRFHYGNFPPFLKRFKVNIKLICMKIVLIDINKIKIN